MDFEKRLTNELENIIQESFDDYNKEEIDELFINPYEDIQLEFNKDKEDIINSITTPITNNIDFIPDKNYSEAFIEFPTEFLIAMKYIIHHMNVKFDYMDKDIYISDNTIYISENDNMYIGELDRNTIEEKIYSLLYKYSEYPIVIEDFNDGILLSEQEF